MREWYQRLVQDGTLLPDEAQARAVVALEEFGQRLSSGAHEKNAAQTARLQLRLRRWVNRFLKSGGGAQPAANNTNSKRGVYLYGGVGRGKTLLMDGFYLHLPLARKLRVHFHQFMRHLHGDMKASENRRDPLVHVARNISSRYDLLCFDEFHVSDITDAMLLGRLLRLLQDGGMQFVLTSNYAPAGLYPNGLARERFLPAIALLEKTMQLVPLDGPKDYRRRLLAARPRWFAPWADAGCQQKMREAFARLAGGIALQNNIKLGGRRAAAVARASDCIWFDFGALCQEARGKEDYLQLAERFSAVFLSGVPRLDDARRAEAARRFTWLVDILYDTQTRLLVGAATPLEELYGKSEGGESGRTLSRLIEMQSASYGKGGGVAGGAIGDDAAAARRAAA